MKIIIILLLVLLPSVLSKCKFNHKNMTYATCNLQCQIVSCDEPYFNAFDHTYNHFNGHDYELFSYNWRQPLDLTHPLFHNAKIQLGSHIGLSGWMQDRIINDLFVDDICEMAFIDVHYLLDCE